MYNSRQILNIRVDFLNKDEVLSRIDGLLSKGMPEISPQILCTTNPEFILAAQKDPEFADIINNSFLSVPDGVGVLYAKLFLDIVRGIIPHTIFPQRVSGADLIYDCCSLAESKGYNVFLLGGWPTDFWGRPLKNPGFDLATEAANSLKEKYPNLNIIGSTSKFGPNTSDDAETLKYIQEQMKIHGVSHIDMLFVCYGHSKQEKWLQRNMSFIPAKLGLGLGGTFDFVSGRKSRAPLWLQKMHLEWLYRLITQPWRIKRVLKSTVYFMSYLVYKALN